MKRKLAWLLILMLVFTMGITFADDTAADADPVVVEEPDADDDADVEEEEEEADADDEEDADVEEEEEDDEDGEPKGKGKGLVKQAAKKLKNELKHAFNEEKDLLEDQKDLLEDAYELLEEQYEALIEAGQTDAAEALLPELEAAEDAFLAAKSAMMQVIKERKAFAIQQYTAEELQAFKDSGANIREMFQEATILDIGSVIVKKNVIKFDTPPYVKNGRTVVPVRALTESLGAEVGYDPATQAVTITNPETGMVIVLTLGSTEALVNNNVVTLDCMAEATNSRTYVPLRFIAETFGLNVEWNDGMITAEEEPAAEEPAAEEPAAEEPAAEEPAAEEPAAEEPAAEEPAAEEPAAEEPAAEEPAAEEPAA